MNSLRHGIRQWAFLGALATLAPSLSAQTESLEATWTELTQQSELLLLKFDNFDPANGLPPMPAALSPMPSRLERFEWDYAIVQFAQTPTQDDRQIISQVGAEIIEYVPNNAYLVRGSLESLATLERVEGVRASVPFAPAFRVSVEAINAPGQGAQVYNIFAFEGEDFDRIRAEILATSAQMLPNDGRQNRFRVLVTPDRLDDLAQIHGIQWIADEPTAVLRNDRTSWVIQTNENGNTSLWDAGLLGENQIIGHIDDPLDLGNCYFNDPNVPSAGPSHRKVVFHRGSTGNGDHGTHTAATAAGDKEPIDGQTFRNGMAYRSRIAHANLSTISGTNLDIRLQELYNNGARMMTNSWGNDGTTSYDQWARDIDLFSWNNEDALAMWAVTNTGTLKNPENAKNCLAVGATNQTPSQDSHCSGGRGPTSDGRRKPEIYAPGCGIRSANAGTSCNTQSLSGTSMASPAICGAAALVQQYFRDGFYPTGAANGADSFNPTGALIKAVLVNGSVDMTGVGGFPSNTEGWGRLVADNSLFFQGDVVGTYVEDVTQAQGFTGAGQMRSYTVDVVDPSAPLEITLSWHDYPAAAFASLTPVNNLDLRVTSPSGIIYAGNSFSGGQSSGTVTDVLNNLERVRRNIPEVGTWTVEVLATAINQTNQGFGLAVSAILVPCDDCGGGGDPPGNCVDSINYGAPTAGTGGIDPTISAISWPYLGNDAWVLRGEDFLGGASGLCLIGFQQDNDNSAGWTRLVSLDFNTLLLQVAYAGAGPGGGSTSLVLSIPNNPFLNGLTFFAQFTAFDGGAASGVSASDGLSSTICDPNG